MVDESDYDSMVQVVKGRHKGKVGYFDDVNHELCAKHEGMTDEEYDKDKDAPKCPGCDAKTRAIIYFGEVLTGPETLIPFSHLEKATPAQEKAWAEREGVRSDADSRAVNRQMGISAPEKGEFSFVVKEGEKTLAEAVRSTGIVVVSYDRNGEWDYFIGTDAERAVCAAFAIIHEVLDNELLPHHTDALFEVNRTLVAVMRAEKMRMQTKMVNKAFKKISGHTKTEDADEEKGGDQKQEPPHA
jgi:hypothetical protein